MKDYIICTENGKRERNGFSKNYKQKVALGAMKMCLRWHFSPLQKGKKRGVKGRLERLESYFSEHILHYAQELEEGKREQEGG